MTTRGVLPTARLTTFLLMCSLTALVGCGEDSVNWVEDPTHPGCVETCTEDPSLPG